MSRTSAVGVGEDQSVRPGAPTAGPSPSGSHAHRTDIEGLRAIAVVLVLLYHAQVPLFAGGFLGVDVFFVISGFLITRSLVAEAERTGRVALTTFYARRARRLLPAAGIVLVATAAAVRLLLPATMWRDFGGDIIASAAYVINWRLARRSVDYLAEDVLTSPVQHFWSLGIEEQFYLVWPLVMVLAIVLARRNRWSVRAVMGVLLVVAIAVPSLWWSITSTGTQPARAFFDTGTRMWELSAGGLVALVGPGWMAASRWRAPLKAACLVTVVVLATMVTPAVRWPGSLALVAVVPTAVLLLVGGTGTDPVERLLGGAPMQRVGAWSYSLYLWHWPPLAILGARWGGLSMAWALGIVAASFVPAVLSHRLVENPLRFAPAFRRSDGLTLSFGANVSLVAALAGVVVLSSVPTGDSTGTLTLSGGAAEPAAAAPQPGSPDEPGPSAASTVPVDAGSDAAGTGTDPADATPTRAPTDAADATPTRAPTAPPLARGPVGAAALTPGPDGGWTTETLLASLDATTSITPAPTRATADLPRVYPDRCHVGLTSEGMNVCTYGDEDAPLEVALLGDSKAGQWGDALKEIALRQGWHLRYYLKSGCAFTSATLPLRGEANTTCVTWNGEVMEALLADPPDLIITSQVSSEALGDDPGGELSSMVDGMVEAYDRLADAGVPAILLMDNFAPGQAVYQCVSQHAEELSECGFPRRGRSGGRAAQFDVAEAADLPTVDLGDLICPTTTCPPVVGNVLVYRQGSHLTATYIDTLVDPLEDRLVPLVDDLVG